MEKLKKMDTNGEGKGMGGVGGINKARGGSLRVPITTSLNLFKPSCPCLKKPIKSKRVAHPCFYKSITLPGPVSINYRVHAQYRADA